MDTSRIPPEVADLLAVIITEAQTMGDPQSAATIAQAAHELRLIAEVHGSRRSPARVTTYNGRLIEEYRAARSVVRARW